ncbi:MAG: hypothetical protein Q4D98_09360 [Planctomycetia bacterium]|nr:hypothetical protein [Planctomycetia bacterium]
MGGGSGPLALFASNDFRGRQVLETCQKTSIPVPYQVAVLGMTMTAYRHHPFS